MADVVDLSNAPSPRKESITEGRLAVQFVNKHGEDFLYCHGHGAWFRFDGSIWRKQDTPIAFHLMRELGVEMSAYASNKVSLQKASFVRAAELFAKSVPELSMTAPEWDTDLFLLGTPGGTVDLKTGKLRRSRTEDRITKSTAVTPSDDAICPTWLRFMAEATNNDHGLIRFLQQICGYALTGDISEQMLFFIFGEGGNGKGTFLGNLASIMADYAITAPMEALESHKTSQHTTDLAMMRGARLVSASETQEGVAWDEKRIKALTGGDKITARLMHKDNMTFTPQLTLVVIGNHEPTLRTVDKAIQRRFNMIPFTHEPKRVDTQLEGKLQAEWPAILQWMIEGCLDWQKNGFVRPARVIEETERYFEEQDTFGQWLRESCDVDQTNDHMTESSSILFASWAKFAIGSGLSPGTAKTFAPNMKRRKFKSQRFGTGVRWKGIGLRGPSIV